MNLRQAAQQALEEMDDHMYRADTHEFYEAKEALRAALAEPQTTHWEGCEAVHPECKATPRKPLTDEEIATIWGQKPRWHAPPIGSTDIDFARAVIAAYEAKQGDQT